MLKDVGSRSSTSQNTPTKITGLKGDINPSCCFIKQLNVSGVDCQVTLVIHMISDTHTHRSRHTELHV